MMHRLFKLIAISAVCMISASCTTTTGLSSSQQPGEGIPGQGIPEDSSSNYYDTRSSSDTTAFPYTDGANPNGQVNIGAAGGSDRIVYFAYDSYEVSPEYRPLLEAHARQLLSNPGLRTVLEGHADERGTREYNIGLGDSRGAAVRRLLIAMGVPPQQIGVVSYGEERPAVAGQNESAYQLNRRVEIVY